MTFTESEISSGNEYEEALAAVVIPAAIRQNETPVIQQLVAGRVLEIQEEHESIGQSQVAIAEHLHFLRSNLKKGSWTAFIESGVTGLSKKASQDLENAWTKWLKDSEVSPKLLAMMSARTLNAMANAEPKQRERVYNAIEERKIEGSESEVKRILNPNRKSKPKAALGAFKDLPSDSSEADRLIHATKLINQQGAQIDTLTSQKDRLLNDQKEKAKTIAGLKEEIRQLKEQAKAASY
ncbi:MULTISPECIES: hypothetical protein [unclassified Prochlorococcus]|uniref:hypothetical protein n=4 Tax=Prochlorococcus TaxID=1218 RepID=UPI000533917B|nr:hypothetical protein [Prochlorococcus sp. MIT 0701]KGG24382.1 hypothetical protein EV12_3027 [Prochlorococcus sp. MIT 0701]